MLLSNFKKHLLKNETVLFRLENGIKVPNHFHVTEVGWIQKHYIDCGGTIRKDDKVNFQLWEANDYDHRLKSSKLINIIELSEKTLGINDFEIEIEYQLPQTIGKFEVDFDGEYFVLISKLTDCLAKDKCGIEATPTNIQTCAPGSGCC